MDANPDRVRAVLAGLRNLPAAVASWEVEAGEDAYGYDAVWVWAILVEDDVPFVKRQAIRDHVYDEVRAGFPDIPTLVVSPGLFMRACDGGPLTRPHRWDSRAERCNSALTPPNTEIGTEAKAREERRIQKIRQRRATQGSAAEIGFGSHGFVNNAG